MAIAAAVASFGRVDAAPIHTAHEFTSKDPVSHRTWSEYVLAGPSVWSSIAHPPLTRGIEDAIWRKIRTDAPESDPYVQFFLFKQSLDPARFDHYHPRLALVLDRIVAAAGPNPPTSTVPSTSNSSPVQAQQIDSTSVPEPKTLLLAMGMAAYAIIWRRSTR